MKLFIKRVIVLLLVIAQLLPVYNIPAARAADKIDSKIRFNDFYGEVKIRPDAEEDDSYEFVDLDTVIYEGDRIKTEEDSGAILGLEDMSTYVIKPDSVLVIHKDEGNVSKIEMLAGSMWGNIKKMAEGKSLDIEMSQCVCGINGTTIYAQTSVPVQKKLDLNEIKKDADQIKEQVDKIQKDLENAKNGEREQPFVIQKDFENAKNSEKGQELNLIEQQLENKLLEIKQHSSTPKFIIPNRIQAEEPLTELRQDQLPELQTNNQLNAEPLQVQLPKLQTNNQLNAEPLQVQLPKLQTNNHLNAEPQLDQKPQLQTFDQVNTEPKQQTEMEKVLASLPKTQRIELKYSPKELEALHNVFNKTNNNNNNENHSEEILRKQQEEAKRTQEGKQEFSEKIKKQAEENIKKQEEDNKRIIETLRQKVEKQQQTQQNKSSVDALASTENNSQSLLTGKNVAELKKAPKRQTKKDLKKVKIDTKPKVVVNLDDNNQQNNNNNENNEKLSEEELKKQEEELKKQEEERKKQEALKKQEEELKKQEEALKKQEEELKKKEEELKKQEEEIAKRKDENLKNLTDKVNELKNNKKLTKKQQKKVEKQLKKEQDIILQQEKQERQALQEKQGQVQQERQALQEKQDQFQQKKQTLQEKRASLNSQNAQQNNNEDQQIDVVSKVKSVPQPTIVAKVKDVPQPTIVAKVTNVPQPNIADRVDSIAAKLNNEAQQNNKPSQDIVDIHAKLAAEASGKVDNTATKVEAAANRIRNNAQKVQQVDGKVHDNMPKVEATPGVAHGKPQASDVAGKLDNTAAKVGAAAGVVNNSEDGKLHYNAPKVEEKGNGLNKAQQMDGKVSSNAKLVKLEKKSPNLDVSKTKKKLTVKKNTFKRIIPKIDKVQVLKGSATIIHKATGGKFIVPAGKQATINGADVVIETIKDLDKVQNELNQELDKANDKQSTKQLIDKLNGQTGQINDTKKVIDNALTSIKKIVEGNAPSDNVKQALSVYNKAVEEGKRFVSIFVEVNSSISVLNKRIASNADSTVVVTREESEAAAEAVKNANNAMNGYSQSLEALVGYADKIEEKLGVNPLASSSSQAEKANEIKSSITAVEDELEDITEGIKDDSSFSDFKDAVSRCEVLLRDLQKLSENIKVDEVGTLLVDSLLKQYGTVSEKLEQAIKDYSSVPEVKTATLKQMNDFEKDIPSYASNIRTYLAEYNSIDRSSTSVDAKKRYVQAVTRTLAGYDRMRRVYTKANRMYTQMEKEFKQSKFKTSEYNDVKESWEKIEQAMTEIDKEASELSSCVESLKSQLESILGQ